MHKVVIIGGGLSGLCTAYALRRTNVEIKILEARPRLGGRIFTQKRKDFYLELGATWFGPQHTSLLKLIQDLEISYKTQDNGREAVYDFRPNGHLERYQIPKQPASTFKFKEGTHALIQAIQKNISAKIYYEHVVTSLKFDNKFQVETENNTFDADFVVMSIPPQLAKDSIHFDPKLPSDFLKLLEHTHTWMSDSIKFSAAFSSASWKSGGFIGTLMSPQQIIQEMYDHSDIDTLQNALVGFLNSSNANLSPQDRQEKVLQHLTNIFKIKPEELLAYQDVDWRKESFTIAETAKALTAHQNNGHPFLRNGFFNNKLFFSASETSAQTPGYMDGAVHRGLEVGKLISKSLT